MCIYLLFFTTYIGPPYDSVENDYGQNQRDNERYPYNYRNPSGNYGDVGGDNFRFPPNDNNNLHNVRPQVCIALMKLLQKCNYLTFNF